MAIEVTEQMRPEKEWFEQAGKQALKTLPDFINHVMNDYYSGNPGRSEIVK